MIVFPMAGLSQRFTQRGYALPKYMLPLWGGTVFDFAVSSFAPSFATRPFLFIYRETGGVRAFLTARAAALGIRRASFAELVAPTAGQAETVELGLAVSNTPPEAPLTIFNIDTFRNPRASPFPLDGGLAGWLEVFRGAGDNWSFVLPAEGAPGIAAKTAEKIPISDLCCTGLYHFASRDLFLGALAQERARPSAPELYVAPIYNHLIAAGHRIGYGTVAAADLVHCGLPHEYEALTAAPRPWEGTA
jgi:hypothetical protein